VEVAKSLAGQPAHFTHFLITATNFALVASYSARLFNIGPALCALPILDNSLQGLSINNTFNLVQYLQARWSGAPRGVSAHYWSTLLRHIRLGRKSNIFGQTLHT